MRGLRLLGETGAFDEFVLTEASPRSFLVLQENVSRVPGARALLGDGRAPPDGGPFDYVDVDPYGSPLPFLPAAFAACSDGGILGVTATDMPVLAGAQVDACRRRYGANPVRGRLGPEGALRILLMVLAREARRSGRAAAPLLAYIGSHHVRAYVRLDRATATPPPIGTIEAREWSGPALGGISPWGPLWLGPLVAPELAPRVEVPPTAAHPRELGRLLERLRSDAEVPAVFYYEPNEIAGPLGLPRPPALEPLIASLRAAGFPAGRTHARPEGLRTTAPRAEVEARARAALSGQSQNARVRA